MGKACLDLLNQSSNSHLLAVLGMGPSHLGSSCQCPFPQQHMAGPMCTVHPLFNAGGEVILSGLPHQDDFRINGCRPEEFRIEAFILPVLPTLCSWGPTGAGAGPSGTWIHSSLVLDVLTLQQVSLRQMLHLTFPRNSNKSPTLLFVLLP